MVIQDNLTKAIGKVKPEFKSPYSVSTIELPPPEGEVILWCQLPKFTWAVDNEAARA